MMNDEFATHCITIHHLSFIIFIPPSANFLIGAIARLPCFEDKQIFAEGGIKKAGNSLDINVLPAFYYSSFIIHHFYSAFGKFLIGAKARQPYFDVK